MLRSMKGGTRSEAEMRLILEHYVQGRLDKDFEYEDSEPALHFKRRCWQLFGHVMVAVRDGSSTNKDAAACCRNGAMAEHLRQIEHAVLR